MTRLQPAEPFRFDFGSSCHVDCSGAKVKFLPSELAATFTSQKRFASLIASFDHSPV